MITIIIFCFLVWHLIRQLNALAPSTVGEGAKRRVSPAFKRLNEYADKLYQDKKYNKAEKAYLGILKLDHKDIQSYNRLGIIYSAQKNYGDAIECFQIACQLAPSATNYHNLGLVFFENRNYIKAIASLEKSIMFEPSSSRYVALAKAYQKVASTNKMVTALEQASELEPSKRTLTMLAEAYTISRDKTRAAEVQQRIADLDKQPKDPHGGSPTANLKTA